MSKFKFEDIYDYMNNVRYFAVNQKYSLQQAKEIFDKEISSLFKTIIRIENKYMRYGYTTNEDGEKQHCWCLDNRKYKNSVPVWVIVYK